MCIWHLDAHTKKYVGLTRQRLADRIKQHVPTSIRTKSNTVREQPPRLCKNNNSKINCESAIGQHLLTNPECAKTYTDDNFRIIGQGRLSFHLSVFRAVLKFCSTNTKKCSRTSPVLSVLMVFFKQLVNLVCMSFEKVWKLIMQFTGT